MDGNHGDGAGARLRWLSRGRKREIAAEMLLLGCSFPSPLQLSVDGGGGVWMGGWAALFAPRVLMEVAAEVRLSMVITEKVGWLLWRPTAAQ